MSEITKKNNKKDSKISNRHFEVLLKISLIIGIIIVSGFIIYYLLTPEPDYVIFGILNENQEAENYPTDASINETISFYLTVDNSLDREFRFKFEIKKGNNDTVLSSSGSNGTSYLTIGNFTLQPNEFNIYGAYNISFWEIKNEAEEFFNVLYLRLNITI
jgi:uncharacterized membrane protein